MKYLNKSLLLLVFIGCWMACKKEEPMVTPPEVEPEEVVIPTLYTEIMEVMKEWYLWNDEIPEVDLASYSSPSDLLNDLAWHPNDQWSYIGQASTVQSFYDEGEFIGHGYGWTWYEDGTLRLNFVYEDSPAYEAGMRRGFAVIEIDNKDIRNINIKTAVGPNTVGHQTTFTVINLEGDTTQLTMAKEVVKMNTVLHTEVNEVAGKQVGYLVFKSFVTPSIAELDQAFNEFKGQGVEELVLDLRYNAGGRVSVAKHLLSWLAPFSAEGQTMFEYSHNTDRAEEHNSLVVFDSISHSLNLNKLVVLTSLGTASASELIINSLRPYIPVVTIGYDTYGKPVGSYGFTTSDEQYVIAPISLRIVNANGEGDYFNGLTPDSYTVDNPKVPFGDDEEWGFQQAMYYIENGSFGDFGKTFPLPLEPVVTFKGIDFEIGSF